MSKYEELCQEYSDARASMRDLAHRSEVFAGMLFKGLIDYLQAPRKKIQPVPPSLAGTSGSKRFTPVGAMELGDDNYYHLGIRLVLSDGQMHPAFQLRVRFKTDGEVFKAGLGPNSEEYTIDPESQSDFHAFYDHLYQTVGDYLRASADAFLRGDADRRGIGFCPASESAQESNARG